MDLRGLRGSDTVFDIESGITTGEDTLWGDKQEKQLLTRTSSGLLNADWAVRAEEPGDAGSELVTCVNIPTGSGESEKLRSEEDVGVIEKTMGNEKPKKKKAYRKHPKPPRPPRPASLDTADQNLMQEISKLTTLKRARMERMTTLRKMKNAKTSSSSTSLCALVITILFCLVIVWQGFCSRSHSTVQFEGSPDSSVGTRGGLISIQYLRNVSPSTSGSTSASL